MRHILSLNIADNCDTEVLLVKDTSTYADFPVTCGILDIKVPGFKETVEIEVQPGFDLVLTACDLKIQTTGCNSDRASLPDGIYQIKYSISPNDQVYVEYAHLRVTSIMNKYFQELCQVEAEACEPTEQIKDQLEALRLIRMYIDAAKAQVEYCHELAKGMELIKYAQSQLLKFSNDKC